jgi:SulP family sulfate permease
VVILLVTFGLTVFADLVVAVNIGVILATLHFLRRMASSVEVREATREELGSHLRDHGLTGLPPGVLVYTIDGPFFFGAVENFERALASTHTDPGILVIRLGWVPFMDITALQTLEEVVVDLHRRAVTVMLTGANERVRFKLERAGILDLVGRGNVFADFSDAIAECIRRTNPDERSQAASASTDARMRDRPGATGTNARSSRSTSRSSGT